MNYLIDVFAIIGVLCLACLIAFAVLWVLSSAYEERHRTQPLPPEPIVVTQELEV